MELGITIPLQKYIKQPSPPYGQAGPFSWDLHKITLGGRPCLLAVHSLSRYTFTLFDVNAHQWADLPDTFARGLGQSLAAIGLGQAAIHRYFDRAGPPLLSKTHGRCQVAHLNRAWEDVVALGLLLDTTRQCQPLLDEAVNQKPCRCAGSPELGPAQPRLLFVLQG